MTKVLAPFTKGLSVIDLGAGRGLVVLQLTLVHGVQARGIEVVGERFKETAKMYPQLNIKEQCIFSMNKIVEQVVYVNNFNFSAQLSTYWSFYASLKVKNLYSCFNSRVVNVQEFYAVETNFVKNSRRLGKQFLFRSVGEQRKLNYFTLPDGSMENQKPSYGLRFGKDLIWMVQ